MRIAVVTTLLVLIFGAIGTIFWYNEYQFSLPTPVPENYQYVALDSVLNLEGELMNAEGKPLFLHFYNPDCPCSRFNMQHFNELTRNYKNVDFYVVMPYGRDLQATQEALDLSVPVIEDSPDKRLAQACGVYATPQAVLVDTVGQLYYRGNFNRARYCSSRKTNFAEQALQALLAGQACPQFGALATKAYGCSIYEEKQNPIENLFSASAQ